MFAGRVYDIVVTKFLEDFPEVFPEKMLFESRKGNFMKWIADIILVVILLLAFFLGKKRGFFRSVMDLIGTALAMGVAIWLGTLAAQWAFEEFLRAPLLRQVTEALDTVAPEGAASAVLGTMPDILTGTFSLYGITEASVNQAVAQASGAAADAVVNLLQPMIVSLLRALFSLVLFVFLLVVIRILTGALGRIFRLPVLRQLDHGLGALLGLAQGVLIVGLLCFCAQILGPLGPEWFQSTMDASWIYQGYLGLFA